MARKRTVRLTRAAMPSVKAAKNYDAEAKKHGAAARRHHRLWLYHLGKEAAAKIKRDKALDRALRHRKR